jgi:hypothetical protein
MGCQSIFISIAAILIAQLLCLTNSALAQERDCSAYLAAVRSGTTSGSVPIVPDRLLTDTDSSVWCLIKTLEGLKDSAQLTSLPAEVRVQFLSATGGLRAIISKLNADDEKSGNSDGLNGFIRTFRNNASVDVISILTFGARSDTYEVRSNSLLILANVIDNTTVCVPLDHLWDPDIGKLDNGKDYSVRGRANLLSVVSVVAPWAYSENFYNIKRVKDYIWMKIDKSDPNLKQTVDILNNIQFRLDSQTNKTNMNVALPGNLKRKCMNYVHRWATADQLQY